jgi:hypothetical protein
MTGWAAKRKQWAQAVQTEILKGEGGKEEDSFERLERFKQIALRCAETVLGVSGGKLRSLIPHHSSEFIKLRTRLTLLKAVRRELLALRTGSAHSSSKQPSRALRKAWDMGLYPSPAVFSSLSDPWKPTNAKFSAGWLHNLSERIAGTTEEIRELRRVEVARALEQSRLAAVNRMHSGGELRRLLHPPAFTLHSPLLRTRFPNSFTIAGCPTLLQTFEDAAQRAGATLHPVENGRILVQPSTSQNLTQLLTAATQTGLAVELETKQERVVSSVQDRLSAWEYALSTEAAATKQRCSKCGGRRLTPLPVMQGCSRVVVTWCSDCNLTTDPVVRSEDY